MADENKLTQTDIDKAVKAAVDKVTEEFEARIEAIDAKKQEALDEAKRAKAELRKAKEISPEDVEKLHAEIEELTGKLSTAEKAAKEADKAREKAVKDLEAETAFTERLLIQDGTKSALIAAGVKDETFLDALTAKFANGAKVVREGNDRKAMLGDKPLPEAISEYAASEHGKKFVAAANNSGGGAPGGGKDGGGKTMSRAAFDALGQGERAAFAKEGGRVVDEAA